MTSLDYYTCEQAFQYLESFLDNELTPREMQRVSEHLDICAMCSKEFRFQQDIIEAIRLRIRAVEVPATLYDRIGVELCKAASDRTDH